MFSTVSKKTDVSRRLSDSEAQVRQVPPKLILLFGPTGVGKTDLLDRLFAGRAEVVSADALQIYRGMDIGTAKPDAALLQRLPHHLINIRDISMDFSVGDFCRLADEAVIDILSRNHLPVISGGTAFYLKAWLLGLPDLPASDPAIRLAISKRWDSSPLNELRSELEKIDPVSARRIGTADRYRLMRALEVYEQTGRPLSSFPVPKKVRRDYSVLCIGLRRERDELYRRINQRVEQMFSDGLEDEVSKLRKNGAKESDPGMKAIGYREWFAISDKNSPTTVDEIKSLIARNTRRYAKRQITFFSSLPDVHWFDASSHPETPGGIQETVENFLDE